MNLLTKKTQQHLYKYLLKLATRVMTDEFDDIHYDDLEETVKEFVPKELCGGWEKNHKLYEESYSKGYKAGLTKTVSDLGTPEQINQRVIDHVENMCELDYIFMPDTLIPEVAYFHGLLVGTQTGNWYLYCRKQDTVLAGH